MKNQGITFKTFLKCLPHVVKSRKPILMRSRHGVGKSSVVYQYAEQLGLPVVERRASQMTEGDLLGLPKITPKSVSTSFLPPDWFKQACDEPVVLFIDEIDRGTTEVRQGFFELCDSRKIAGHYLHEDTIVFAAINGGNHGDQYQIHEMDPAELDRWIVFDLEPDVEDWLDWASKNTESMIWEFINSNRNHLEHEGIYEPNKIYPSRRSWKWLSDCLKDTGFLKPGLRSSELAALTASHVGYEASIKFTDFVFQSKDKILAAEDIYDRGLHELTKSFDINQHAELVERIKNSGIWDTKISEDQAKNLANYFRVCPAEIAMTMYSHITSSTVDAIEQSVAVPERTISQNLKKFHYLVQDKFLEYVNGLENKEKK